MSGKKYSIGLDFGTLSARAVIASIDDGSLADCESVFFYPNAIITELGGKRLPPNYALQDPKDYIDALKFLLCDIIKKSGVEVSSIVGIGIDFTDCTVIPVDDKMTPLCMLEKYQSEPHAYAKLWKHHADEKYASHVHSVASSFDKSILSVTGGKMTSEFMIPKLYEIYCEAPSVYKDTYKFLCAGDFIASLLIGGKLIHSKSYSAKQHYKSNDYPSKEFFASVDLGFADVYEKKTVTALSSVEEKAGNLSAEWASLTGLSTSVAIAPPIIDAHSALAASGIKENLAVLSLGTSAVFEAVTPSKKEVQGALAQSYESVAANLTTVEAGVAAMGDLFDWFIQNCLPGSYSDEAKRLGLNPHQYLRSLAKDQKVGEHGLIALDWWNGSRAITLDNELSGIIMGLRLSTKPEDIYRALIESTVFELRRISDCFIKQGINPESIIATGGIVLKDPMLMQICADVLNKPVECLESLYAPALGSAIYGAVAAGEYQSVAEASQKMRRPIALTYYPIKENHDAYENIYGQYLRLCEYFSNENNRINLH